MTDQKIKSQSPVLNNSLNPMAKRQRILTGLAAIALIILIGIIYYVYRAESSGNHVDPDSLTNYQKTVNIVNAFEKRDFKAIPVFFDEPLKEVLPVSRLKKIWNQLNSTFGKFEKAHTDNLEITLIGTDSIVEVSFNFQKDVRLLRLVFNEKGRISGLFFQ